MGAFGNHVPLRALAAVDIVPTTLPAFTARGNMIVLDVVTTAGGAGNLTISAEVAVSGGDSPPSFVQYTSGGAVTTWVTGVANVAGSYRVALAGLVVGDGDSVRLTYNVANAVGNIGLWAETFECPTDSADVAADIVAAINLASADLVAAIGLATAELVVINNSTGFMATAVGNHDAVTATPGFRLLGKATAAAPVAVADGDDAGINTDLGGQTRLASHTVATTSDRGEEVDPLDTRDLPTTWTAAGQSAGPVTSYVSVEHTREISTHIAAIVADGNTFELEVAVTNQPGADPAVLTYHDRTVAWWAAAPTAVGYHERNHVSRLCATWVRYTMTVTGAGVASGWTIYSRTHY